MRLKHKNKKKNRGGAQKTGGKVNEGSLSTKGGGGGAEGHWD